MNQTTKPEKKALPPTISRRMARQKARREAAAYRLRKAGDRFFDQ